MLYSPPKYTYTGLYYSCTQWVYCVVHSEQLTRVARGSWTTCRLSFLLRFLFTVFFRHGRLKILYWVEPYNHQFHPSCRHNCPRSQVLNVCTAQLHTLNGDLCSKTKLHHIKNYRVTAQTKIGAQSHAHKEFYLSTECCTVEINPMIYSKVGWNNLVSLLPSNEEWRPAVKVFPILV